MIIVYHLNNKIHDVVTADNQNIGVDKNLSIAKVLQVLAEQYPNKKIVWCHLHCKTNLNVKAIDTMFHHNRIMLSFQPGNQHFLGTEIGYVETSVFIKVNKALSYPTWQMSSAVGVIHAATLLAVKDSMPLDTSFDYYLNSLAKLAMPLGLLCYSEPRLLVGNMDVAAPEAHVFTLFKFVKQHYKTRWLFLLALNSLLYDKKLLLFPFIYGLFGVKKRNLSVDFKSIAVPSPNNTLDKATIDVIIPTIGRKAYLYDVLCDLRKQSHLPKHVIIVEQNPLAESVSQLDYLKAESWPFKIKHHFIHQTGACNARNLALKAVDSDYVFFADDDIRCANNALSKSLDFMMCHDLHAITLSCKTGNEPESMSIPVQWSSFGSGCSMVKTSALKHVTFNLGFEHGFGEDSDFGAQLRNKGTDVIYFPEVTLKHLKAPIGGFRLKQSLAWKEDVVQPKPSPTVMLYLMNHQTNQQLLGYKTMLFLKFYKKQSIKNPLVYYKSFKKQWARSQFWATALKNKYN